ncbi:hypothetical protein BJ508DRAFT_379844 [Ascobolus immersus RN42]|uniref:Uncharacterized protein n=1 Tax=Ascobolus immersus RN42 TaxID=1160509 RepID=A0A3N4HUV1_ASCIM|nr:hypothetical protein BJ508DRAFT_379844 [Ascobolus immersus RN42]
MADARLILSVDEAHHLHSTALAAAQALILLQNDIQGHIRVLWRHLDQKHRDKMQRPEFLDIEHHSHLEREMQMRSRYRVPQMTTTTPIRIQDEVVIALKTVMQLSRPVERIFHAACEDKSELWDLAYCFDKRNCCSNLWAYLRSLGNGKVRCDSWSMIRRAEKWRSLDIELDSDVRRMRLMVEEMKNLVERVTRSDEI